MRTLQTSSVGIRYDVLENVADLRPLGMSPAAAHVLERMGDTMGRNAGHGIGRNSSSDMNGRKANTGNLEH